MSADSDGIVCGEVFRVKSVPGDGNCFFRALAEALGLGTDSLPGHVAARLAVVRRVRSSAAYRRRMGRSGTPATRSEVMAAAEALGTDIAVHTATRVYRFRGGHCSLGPALHLRFTGTSGAGHYDLLQPVRDAREVRPLESCNGDPLVSFEKKKTVWVSRLPQGGRRNRDCPLLRGGGPAKASGSRKNANKKKKRASTSIREASQIASSKDQDVEVKGLVDNPPMDFVDLLKAMSDTQLADVYFHILHRVRESLVDGNFKRFQDAWKLVRVAATAVQDGVLRLTDWFQRPKSPFHDANLLVVACQLNRWDVLRYLLVHNDNALDTCLLRSWDPDSRDQENHNAMFYVLKSGCVGACRLLLMHWPAAGPPLLEKVYEELLLKRVPLSDAIAAFVEQFLHDVRFSVNSASCNAMERIAIILDAIASLIHVEDGPPMADSLLHCAVQFIVRNVVLLRRAIAPDYQQLPWEEIQFLLVTYLERGPELHHFVLTRSKVMGYLKAFSQGLSLVEAHLISKAEVNQFTVLSDSTHFQDIYKDFKMIRDVCSLEKLSEYLGQAVNADCSEMIGQLVIQRTLAFVGDCFRLYPRTPKLSLPVVNLLFFLCPVNVRYVFSSLPNVLHHASSLCESHHATAPEFFRKVQQDLKAFSVSVRYALFRRRLCLLKDVAHMVLAMKHVNELKEVLDGMRRAPPRASTSLPSGDRLTETNELLKTEELIAEISDVIQKKTSTAIVLNELNSYIASEKEKHSNIFSCYTLAFLQLHGGIEKVSESLSASQALAALHQYATTALNTITSYAEATSYGRLPELIRMLTETLEIDGNRERSPKVRQVLSDLNGFCDLQVGKCNPGLHFEGGLTKPRPTVDALQLKLQLLNKVLCALGVTVQQEIASSVTLIKKDATLRAALEVLVLDIMSELKNRCCLPENAACLDERAGILIGRELLEYLAHDEPVAAALLTSPAVAVLLAALKYQQDGRRLLECVPSERAAVAPVSFQSLKIHLLDNLSLVALQEDLFQSAEEGDAACFFASIQAGADVSGRRLDSWTALHCAVKGGNFRIIQRLRDAGVDVNCRTLQSESTLHIAAAHGQKRMVDFLLNHCAMSVGVVDDKKRTPLHIAALHGHLEVVNCLLQHRAERNAKDSSGWLPVQHAALVGHESVLFSLMKSPDTIHIPATHSLLATAAEMGHAGIVRRLIKDFGADVNAKNDRNWAPLHAAAFYGHLDVVKILVKLGADVNSLANDGYTPLLFAAKRGHEAVISVLLNNGADVDVKDREDQCTPMLFAAYGGHLRVVEKLIKKKADVNIKSAMGTTPLMMAASEGHLEMVRVLLQQGAVLNEYNEFDGMSALHYAASHRHPQIVELLIGAGAQVNSLDTKRHYSALEFAAGCGDVDTARILIRNGAVLDAADIEKRTALMIAAHGGHEDVVRLLLGSGACVSATDIDGDTALHFASASGRLGVVQLLLDSGLDVNATNTSCETALHVAARQNYVQVVKLLIANGADVNAANDSGDTPLYKAICAASVDVANLLVEAGAGVNVETNSGVSLLLAAVKRNCKEIVQLLVDNGADVNKCSFSRPTALGLAVFEGFHDVAQVLLSSPRTDVSVCTPDGSTILHVAAQSGHAGMVTNLIDWGFDVNVRIHKPGYQTHGTTPLHVAANMGFSVVIRALLARGADVDARDALNRSPIHLSVGLVDCSRALLTHSPHLVNAVGPNEFRPLHFAVVKNSSDVVEYLVSCGADIHARNTTEAKPIHMAAFFGFLPLVKFFLENGIRVADRGSGGYTLLHLAIPSGNDELVWYLLDRGADVNATNPRSSNLTPLHVAAAKGKLGICKLLLDHGAMFDSKDSNGRTPAMHAKEKDVTQAFAATVALFKAIKKQDCQLVHENVANGAFVNARASDGATTLSISAWKGCKEIVSVLLENGADPNLPAKSGGTALHYAAKYGHTQIVKDLLAAGAAYDFPNSAGEAPALRAGNMDIRRVLDFMAASFNKALNNDLSLIDDVENPQNADLVKPLLNARNQSGQSLIDVCVVSDFTHVAHLKCFTRGASRDLLVHCERLKEEGRFSDAEKLYRKVLEDKRSVFTANASATLDIEEEIANMMCFQNKSLDAVLATYKKIYEIRLKQLGPQHALTLNSKQKVAVGLHKVGKNEEALQILREIHKLHQQSPQDDSGDTLTPIVMNIAMVLQALGDYGEALRLFRNAYEKTGKDGSQLALACLHSIGTVLIDMKREKEAVLPLQEVLRQLRKQHSAAHVDVSRAQLSLATAMHGAGQEDQALVLYADFLNAYPGQDGGETRLKDIITAKERLSCILCTQGKLVPALRLMEEVLEQGPRVFGPDHPVMTGLRERLDVIKMRFQLVSPCMMEKARRADEVVRNAVKEKDVSTASNWLRLGCDPNACDSEGRSLLMFAVNSGHMPMICLLLQEGADPTRLSKRSNTPLHLAAAKGDCLIAKAILSHVQQHRTTALCAFVNTRTAAGTSAMHIAAKSGDKELIMLLLTFGAAYDAPDANGSTPMDMCADPDCRNVIQIVHEMFTAAETGNKGIGEALDALIPLGLLKAVLNARNNQLQTLAQVAIANQHKEIGAVILKVLRQSVTLESY